MAAKDTFIIQGLAGKKTLRGSVAINGAKNAVLKAMAAAVLFDGPVTLENVPDTDDVHTQGTILKKLGAKVEHNTEKRTLSIDPTSITSTDIDFDLAQSMRSSVVLTGPLLARFGTVSFPAPGGCVLGTRAIDLFIEGYKKMGSTAEIVDNLYKIHTMDTIKGMEIFFHTPTVGGTETLMMAATLATGTVVLKNCAMEPEIVSVAEWLNGCGARIVGAGSTTITIEGTAGKLLSAKGPSYITIPDRIEAGSFLILGALCADELTITNCRPDHMEAVIRLLKEAGVPIEIGATEISIKGNAKLANSSFVSFNVRTHEYPGFPTDLQSPMVTFLTQSTGESIIFETIFGARFKFTEDLTALGANVTVMNPREILVKGPTPFTQLPDAEELRSHDLRAGFAVVLAALLGTGTFTVTGVNLIDRGYEKLEERLTALGAEVKRVSA